MMQMARDCKANNDKKAMYFLVRELKEKCEEVQAGEEEEQENSSDDDVFQGCVE